MSASTKKYIASPCRLPVAVQRSSRRQRFIWAGEPDDKSVPPTDRIIAWKRPLTALCVTASLLAACSGDGSNDTEGGAATTNAAVPRMRALAATVNPNGWVAVTQPNDVLLQNLTIPADAPARGMWSGVGAWPMNGLHQAVLPDGKVLSWGTSPDGNAQNGRYFDVWDPNRGLFDAGAHNLTYDPNRQDSFCAPSVYLADGRLMMTGGNANLGNQTYTPSSGAFASAGNLADARWYATMLKLADGRPIVVGGIDPYTEGQWTNPDVAAANGQSAMTPEVYENGRLAVAAERAQPCCLRTGQPSRLAAQGLAGAGRPRLRHRHRSDVLRRSQRCRRPGHDDHRRHVQGTAQRNCHGPTPRSTSAPRCLP